MVAMKVARFTDQQIHQMRRAIIPRPLVADELSISISSSRSCKVNNQGTTATAPNIGATVLPPLPSYEVPISTNVQGDVYTGFPKGAEDFIFFTIADANAFKLWLRDYRPTHSFEVCENLSMIYERKLHSGAKAQCNIVQTQIAFSRLGLDFLGETEEIQDLYFDRGPMFHDRKLMGDQSAWDPLFSRTNVHVVILVAAKCEATCKIAVDELVAQISPSVKNPETDISILHGRVRPGPHKGHEHFGFMDGISQPALRGLTDTCAISGQLTVDPGVIVMGYNGDPNHDDPHLPKRPDWTKDGSIMVFRKLQQDVPEFDTYLKRNGRNWREYLPKEYAGKVTLTDDEGAALFGARMIGRWKSGAPLQNFPVRDNPRAALDKAVNNDFDYSIEGERGPSDIRCPFTAHTRKTAPRQLDPYLQRKYIEAAAIIRSGIPFGPEVTENERRYGKSDPSPSMERGLLFVCYQSCIANGFMLQTDGFAGNHYFPITGLKPVKHGQDPILGWPSQPDPIPDNGSRDCTIKTSANAANSIANVTQEFFVTSRGGEYFFVPSLLALKQLAGN
ncbi:hypothetical protein FRB95_006564 [Tulasnella sp. JGI-2019a]|nr:hypothetical protein FRB95_006564 [Tulasnella sp. JGI-2019a]